MLSPWKFSLFKIAKLPLAFVAGLKLKTLTANEASTTVRYKYITKNPFKSLYFAVLAMTAELSTGALALLSVAKYSESIAVLVVASAGTFHKKAVGQITFVCDEGEGFQNTLQACSATKTPQTFTAKTIGYNSSNEIVCEYTFTWSFKFRS